MREKQDPGGEREPRETRETREASARCGAHGNTLDSPCATRIDTVHEIALRVNTGPFAIRDNPRVVAHIDI